MGEEKRSARSFWRLKSSVSRRFSLALLAGLAGLGCVSSPAPPVESPTAPAESPFAAPAEKLTLFLKDRLALDEEQLAKTRRIATTLLERNAQLSDVERLNKRRVLDALEQNLALFDQEMFSILMAEQRLKFVALKREFREAIRPRPGMRFDARPDRPP